MANMYNIDPREVLYRGDELQFFFRWPMPTTPEGKGPLLASECVIIGAAQGLAVTGFSDVWDSAVVEFTIIFGHWNVGQVYQVFRWALTIGGVEPELYQINLQKRCFGTTEGCGSDNILGPGAFENLPERWKQIGQDVYNAGKEAGEKIRNAIDKALPDLPSVSTFYLVLGIVLFIGLLIAIGYAGRMVA